MCKWREDDMSTHGECRRAAARCGNRGGKEKQLIFFCPHLSSELRSVWVQCCFFFLSPEVLLFDCMYLMLTLGESPITSSSVTSGSFRLIQVTAHIGESRCRLSTFFYVSASNSSSAMISRLSHSLTVLKKDDGFQSVLRRWCKMCPRKRFSHKSKLETSGQRRVKEEKSHSLYYTADFLMNQCWLKYPFNFLFLSGKPHFWNPYSAWASKMRPWSKLKFKFRISSGKQFMDKR